jgi:hypothetical protein
LCSMTAATTVMCFMNEIAKYSQEFEIPGMNYCVVKIDVNSKIIWCIRTPHF